VRREKPAHNERFAFFSVCGRLGDAFDADPKAVFFSVFECDHQPLDVETEHQAVEENEPQYVIAHDTAEQVESNEKDAIPDGRLGGISGLVAISVSAADAVLEF
jgi:hypothetical protein